MDSSLYPVLHETLTLERAADELRILISRDGVDTCFCWSFEREFQGFLFCAGWLENILLCGWIQGHFNET